MKTRALCYSIVQIYEVQAFYYIYYGGNYHVHSQTIRRRTVYPYS